MADLDRRQDHSTLFLEQAEPLALQDLSNSFSKKDNVMIIVTAMKAVREVWIETLRLRRELAKRYPGILSE